MKATKRITRLCSILLAVVIVMAMSVSSAFAATITINDAVEGQTYSAYKLFDVTSSGDNYAYSTDNSTLVNAIQQAMGQDQPLHGIGLTFTKVGTTDTYNVTASESFNETQAATLAKWLNAQNLTELGLNKAYGTATGTKGEDGQVTAKFNNLGSGYYFVTSSVGSLCILYTTDSKETISEKNEVPTIKKDDVNADDANSPSVGDTVNFEITITVGSGAENYVLHDAMGSGLTLTNSSVTAYIRTENQNPESGSQYTDTLIPNENSVSYEVTYNPNHVYNEETGKNCDFDVEFKDTYLSTLKSGTVIVVKYSATINESAVTDETDPVTNEAILDYGDDQHTGESTTNTEVYSFQLAKTKENNELMDGATFALYNKQADGEAIALVDNNDGTYRVATDDDETTTTSFTTKNGVATIEGLGNGTYYVEETAAPAGYNKLTSRQSITISGADNNVILQDKDGDEVNDSYVSGGLQIINKTGSELPSTGGMGTTVIYIVGGVLVAGAAVLLVTRRRMHA